MHNLFYIFCLLQAIHAAPIEEIGNWELCSDKVCAYRRKLLLC